MAVTPEDAADYLSRTNFKAIIELLTAEAILHRSEDPVLFCRTLLDQKIQSRGGASYAPEQATEYVRQCYADASANADENGRIQGKSSATVGAAGECRGEQSAQVMVNRMYCLYVCLHIILFVS